MRCLNEGCAALANQAAPQKPISLFMPSRKRGFRSAPLAHDLRFLPG